MPAIFVSYRPQDQPDWLLAQVRARVQKDVAVDWVEAGGSLESCQMVLVMIGPQWLSAADAEGRPLIEDPDDPVHATLKRALDRGLRLVPVLLDGTPMPRSQELPVAFQALVRRPAMSLHPQRLDADMGMLVSMIRRTLESSFGSVLASSVLVHNQHEKAAPPPPPPSVVVPPPVVSPAVPVTPSSPAPLRALPEPEELPELANLFAPAPPPLAAIVPPPPSVSVTPPPPAVPVSVASSTQARSMPPPAMASVRPPPVSSADRRERRRARQVQKRRTLVVRIGFGVGAFVLLIALAGLGWMLLHRLIRSGDASAQTAEAVKAADSAVVLSLPPQVASAKPAALPPLTPGQAFRDCAAPTCPLMVVLPAGHFSMGSSAPGIGAYDDERPAHEVSVRKVALGRFEVTFQEWEACFQDKECLHWPSDEGWGRENRPVINVSWEDVQRYLKWLSQKTGQVYRLPTEAEWEYAARAGSTTNYAFGNDEKDLNDYVWFSGNSGNQSHPVGEKKPNAFGLHDMHGSVWEWVQDCWHPNYQGAPTTGAAWDTDCRGGNRRTVRGGGWNDTARVVRSTYRYGYLSDGRSLSQGFRVARELNP
jgi:formylglycine-generating enzyme required for sulfatase activity